MRIVYDAGKPANPAALGVDPASPGTVAFMKRIAGNVQTKAITGGHNHNPRLMHRQFIVRDGAASGGTVSIGSTNFTDDSWALQENNIICVDSPELCALYEKDFAELWARGDIDTTGARDRGTVHVGSAGCGATFRRQAMGPPSIMKSHARIGGARRRLKICSMLITSGGILGTGRCTAPRAFAEYGGIYDRTQMESVFDQWHGSPVEWKIGPPSPNRRRPRRKAIHTVYPRWKTRLHAQQVPCR